MNLILFDDEMRKDLLPFTHTRPIADIRCGILTLRERWERLLRLKSGSLTERYLQDEFPQRFNQNIIYVNAAVIATEQLAVAISGMRPGESLYFEDMLLAAYSDSAVTSVEELKTIAANGQKKQYQDPVSTIRELWDIFQKNAAAIQIDFGLLTKGKASQRIPEFVTVLHHENIFIQEGAQIGPCVLNATAGPIYIGRNAEIMEGSMIRGPFALGEKATVKMGTKVYEATTIGPGCKVGGEVNNVVFFNNSNKGHDGFLGNSVVGDWCNFGADSNCSNLKNNYGSVSVWHEGENRYKDTSSQFCGLFMGDHSKCGINTMFNTGTVVGVSCNIFGAGFPDKFVPSFTWGGATELSEYRLEKALDTANRMMQRRNRALDENEKKILTEVFHRTKPQRKND